MFEKCITKREILLGERGIVREQEAKTSDLGTFQVSRARPDGHMPLGQMLK